MMALHNIPMKKAAVIAMLVMSMAPLLTTCGRGAPPPKEDYVPPTVLATTPRDGFMDYPVGDPIKIEFSEEMDPATINAQTIVLTSSTGTAPISGSVLYGNTTAVFEHAQPLEEGTLYTVTIRGTGVKVNPTRKTNLAKAQLAPTARIDPVVAARVPSATYSAANT